MKKIIFTIIDLFNIDSLISSYFRNSAFLIRLIPDPLFYNQSTKKKIKVNGINFIIEPSDLVQYALFKPKLVNTEMYGIQYLLVQAPDYGKAKNLIFDIGANCGQFSLLTLSYLKEKFPDLSFTIHSFEPNPYVFERLSGNIKENANIAENIKCFKKGIGNESATLQIQMPLRNSGAGSLLRNYQHEPNETHSVDIISLDEHVKKEGLTEYKICFLKIDVEGFEPQVLKGANDTITNFLPDIYIEMGQDEDKQRFIINFLKGKNYILYAEVESGFVKITDSNELGFIRESGLYNIFATCSENFKL